MEVGQAAERTPVLPPGTYYLNIGQFLEESHSDIQMQEQWLLAYAHTLQCVVETTTVHCWVN